VAKVHVSRIRGRQAGSESGQARVKTRRARKRETGKAGAETKRWLTRQTRRTGNRQTENTGINTQGITGKMGDTWKGVETSTRTGETGQGVTVLPL
jgi:hypothetical protein